MGAGMSKGRSSGLYRTMLKLIMYTDSYCMYTNKPYATSFRGFGHPELTFVMERTMDKLAKKLEIDPLELRLMNAIKPGDNTPTQAELNASNLGDISSCLLKAKELLNWEKEPHTKNEDGKIISRGLSAF